MKKVFPLNIKIGQILGIISILNDNGGSISLQELSDESFLQADDLVNIIDACKILGLLSVKGEKIKLKRKLAKRNQHEITALISEKIVKIEPFSRIIKDIKFNGKISTTELFHDLVNKGLINYRDNILGIEEFKKNLLVIGIRLKILSYNHEEDIWKVHKE